MRLVLGAALALVLASALFVAFPGLDLAVSAFFYDGSGFPVTAIPAVEVLRVIMWSSEDLWFLMSLALVLLAWRGPVLSLTARDWGFQALLFALGPGLVVNGILKRFWGRARPFMIEHFGGSARFSRAWEITDQCARNCSFVSGEMAGASVLAVALVLTLRANRARIAPGPFRAGQGLALAIPALTAWQRVAVGRHYLSDVVISAALIGLLAAALCRLLQPPSCRAGRLTSHGAAPR